jgi:ABC-type Zn uptake system ZnuABC Zn-binding protein ZnuA
VRSRHLLALAALSAPAALVMVMAACTDEESTANSEAPTPLVVVPNDILGDLVSRVACVEELEVRIGGLPEDGTTPVAVLTLDEPAATDVPDPDGALLISVPAVTTTIDNPDGPDAWVWLDPIRFQELSEAVGGALAASGEFDAGLIDRCLARFRAEMDLLDAELYELTQTIPESDRVMDVSLPGTLYFANRFEFGIAETGAASEAGRMMSVDSLGEATSYDELMRSNVEDVVELLATQPR